MHYMKNELLTGLIAAPFTPFDDKGNVNLDIIPAYADLLTKNGVSGAFVCGTTGESLSMTTEERLAVAAKWVECASKDLKVIVHVGHTSIEDARRLTGHASEIGAWGVGQMAPCFIKPKTLDDLVEFCAETASAAPELPYYYYHMPAMTGVNFKMFDFLNLAKERIPNLAGVKYTYEDLMDMQLCRTIDGGRFDMLFGRDELLICGLALGCTGAVGSTYNFMAPLYLELWDAFTQGDVKRANELQLLSMQVIQTMFSHGDPLICGKAIMKMLGVDCGGMRLPLRTIEKSEVDLLRDDLDRLGFFDI